LAPRSVPVSGGSRSAPHRPDGDPRDDLDLASYGIVKVLENGRTEPKAAFAALASHYRPV